jgi:hypothetical protein
MPHFWGKSIHTYFNLMGLTQLEQAELELTTSRIRSEIATTELPQPFFKKTKTLSQEEWNLLCSFLKE